MHSFCRNHENLCASSQTPLHLYQVHHELSIMYVIIRIQTHSYYFCPFLCSLLLKVKKNLLSRAEIILDTVMMTTTWILNKNNGLHEQTPTVLQIRQREALHYCLAIHSWFSISGIYSIFRYKCENLSR